MTFKMDGKGFFLLVATWVGNWWVAISQHATQANISFIVTLCVNISIAAYYIRKNIKMK